MKAIASGQLEGFPSDDEIRTAYVEHDIQGDSSDFTSAEYVLSEPRLKDGSKEEVVKMLHGMGFSDVLVESKVSALSGGWKMKLALARAMMLKPALLLLDEPSNHLSVGNVTWLVNYLTGENCKDVTSLIVSHDTGFLDRVVTDVVHYESFKLRRYKGTVQHFVKIKPEAKAYYELEAASYSFKFPEPGFLDGVNNKGKTILRMNKVGYTYPGRDKAVITDISLAISLASRVAVIGENGAGKSTCIKVLTGESTPTVGTVWKHPALRVAYVAQHAFHHIEHHLDWTPSEYIQWRYATGEDREALQKESREITEEEAKKMAEKITINGEKLVVEQITSRRKLKTSYEYEVKWVGQGVDKNAWLPRYKLEEMGFGKMCDALDAKEAAQAGLRAKPLTAANIAKHLADIGLEPEFTLHSRMRGLSGGQKLKVVIGASTWMAPHVIVLDEPSNFVDRDTLGALSQALRDFGGAVVIISHNHEFTKAICTEIWTMEHGRLTISGEVGTNAVSEKVVAAELGDEVTDAAGNVIKIAQKKKLNSKEARRKAKERAIRRKRGEEVTDTEDEEYDE
jgi:elongation factor 3